MTTIVLPGGENMKRVICIALTAGTALGAFVQPAVAQTAVSATAAQATPDQPASVGEIIVTANKRAERLQHVPIAISVITGTQLTQQNVNQVADLTRTTPTLNTAGPFGALSIRGIGSVSFSRTSEGSVGVVVDNVALAGTSTNPPQLFDIARVEVLEGPQGTLFGRNSSAGVLNIVTNAPDPGKFEVIAHADIGTRANYVGRAVVNIPVSDNSALRVSGSYSQAPHNLYDRFRNDWSDNDGKSARARFLWTPIPDLKFNLIADYTDIDQRGGAPWAVYYSTPGSPLSQRLAACGVVVKQNNDQGCVDGGNRSSTQSYGVSGQVDAQLGSLTLTSISAYRAVASRVPAYDVDSVPVDLFNQTGPFDTRNYSQEFRLTSPSQGLVTYVLGLYYFDSAFDGSVTQFGPLLTDSGFPFPVGQTLTTHASTTSKAAFGQATVNLTHALRIILGARYGNEDVHARTVGTLPSGSVAPIQSIAGVDGQVSDNYFSYKAGLQYDFSHAIMGYASYTRGYKGPSINDQGGGPNIPIIVRPEIPHAGEIGLKTTFLNGRLAANIAAYYTRVDDFQAQFFDPALNAFIFGNAPSLKSKGVSIDLLGRPLQGLTLNLGGTFNDAKYGKGYSVACAQLQTAAQGCTGGIADASGNRLVGSPRWKVTASAQYETNLGSRAKGFIQADMVYTSRINWDAAYDPIDTNAPAAIFGGRIGVKSQNDRFGISVFARNLFDVYRPIVRFQTSTAAQELDPQSYSQITGPESHRTIGVSLDAKF
jgi:iron complex outermembrane receptor protein